MHIIKALIFSSLVATITMIILVFFGLNIDSLLSAASIVLSISFLHSVLIGIAYIFIGFISSIILLFVNTFL